MKYDIFISYRTKDGFATAQLIFDRLVQKGYRLAFDLETLRSGKFEPQLYARIKECKDFIFVVSEEALAFREGEDWVRLELAYALKLKKNIIPVLLHGVEFPKKEQLPEDVVELAELHAERVVLEHVGPSIKRICKLLYSRRRHHLMSIVGWIALFIVITTFCYSRVVHKDVYPVTYYEKQECESILAYLIHQLYNINAVSNAYENWLDCATRAIMLSDVTIAEENRLYFNNTIANLPKAVYQDDFFVMAQRSKVINATDLQDFPNYYNGYLNYVRQSMDFLSEIIKHPLSKENKQHLIDLQRKSLKLYNESIGLHIIALLYKVEEESLQQFKNIVVPELTSIPILKGQWPSTQAYIEQDAKYNHELHKKIIDEITTIVGNLNLQLNVEVQRAYTVLEQVGITSEDAEHLIQGVKRNASLKIEVEEKRRQLKRKEEKLREKFSPLETDNDEVLWNKMLQLNKFGFVQDVRRALEIMRKKTENEFEAQLFNVAERILNEPQNLPFTMGVIICDFEPPATSHAIFKKGDVITKIDNENCAVADLFKTVEGATYSIYRLNSEGHFEAHSLVMPAEQPRSRALALPF